MTYLLFTATFVILLIWVMHLTKELDDFKQHVFKFEHGQIDINKKTCDILSVLSDYSHTHETKE